MSYRKDFTHKWNLSIPPSVHSQDMVVKSIAASKTCIFVVVWKLESIVLSSWNSINIILLYQMMTGVILPAMV